MFYDWDRCYICVKMLKVINWELTRADQEGAGPDPQVPVLPMSEVTDSLLDRDMREHKNLVNKGE